MASRSMASASTRCSRATCSMPTRSGHPLETTALEHLGYKALTEEDVCGRGAKAIALANTPPEAARTFACERADLALQLGGRGSAPMLEADGLDVVYRDLERPLIPVLASMERAGVRVDSAALAAQSQQIEREMSSLEHADLRAGGRAVQHQLAAAALAHSVRQAAAPDAQAQRQNQNRVHRGRRARGARARARPAAPDSRVARAAEAEGHLHRRAAAARESRKPDASTPASTRPSPRRDA